VLSRGFVKVEIVLDFVVVTIIRSQSPASKRDGKL
jgi:hypothetical protein